MLESSTNPKGKTMKKKRSHKAKKTYVTNPAKRSRSHRRSYKANPAKRHRRHYKRNPGSNIKEIGITIGTAAAGAILGPKLFSKLPLSPMLSNLAMAAVGAGLAYVGRRKPVLMGLGAGLAVAGISRAAVNAVPMLAGDGEMTPEQSAAVLAELTASAPQYSGEAEDSLNGSFEGSFNGSFQGSDTL